MKTASRRALTRALDRNDLDALAVSPSASSITNTSAGYPAVTVPAGYLGGAPFGAILTGRKWSEPDLIGYAYAFEQATKAWRSPADLNQRFAEACPS